MKELLEKLQEKMAKHRLIKQATMPKKEYKTYSNGMSYVLRSINAIAKEEQKKIEAPKAQECETLTIHYDDVAQAVPAISTIEIPPNTCETDETKI